MSDFSLENEISPKFVMALMGHLLKNPVFFNLAVGKIEAKYISDPIVKKIYCLCTDFYKKHQRLPTEQELYLEPAFRVEEPQTQSVIRSKMAACDQASREIKLEIVKHHLLSWYRSQVFFTNVFDLWESAKLLRKRGRSDEIWPRLAKIDRDIQETSFDPPVRIDLSDPHAFFDEMAEESKHLVSIGHPEFDKMLNPNAETGSLRAGEVTVLMGPINVGKTTTLMSIVVNNVLLGNKSVLFIGGEGVARDLVNKLYACATGLSAGDIVFNRSQPEVKNKIDKVSPIINKYLTMKMDSSKTIEEVESAIEKAQEDRINEHGKGYDLVVYDYMGRLTTREAAGGKMSRHEALGRVAVSFEALATKHKFHIISPHQVNREGIKANEGKGYRGKEDSGHRWLSQSDSGESIEVLKPVANVITINCPPDLRAKNLMAFYIDKCRSAPVGTTIIVETNFSASRTIYHKAKAYCYKGNTFEGGIVAKMLAEETKESVNDFFSETSG